ncbi:MAG: branched-chain amino acid ABC transporter permease [Alphaproteobacteria bacterium]|nr:branched-chain amino acid ABC transporter permease [Alphaproteobacteria bacterium]
MALDLLYLYVLDILLEYGVFLIIALGCYVTMMAGQLSMAHGALASLGAYATAVITVELGLPVWLGVVAGMVAGALGGLFMTYVVAYRLVGMYLAIATFAFAEGLAVVYRNIEFIGGTLGIVGIPIVTSLPLVAAVIAVVSFFLWRFEKSFLGRAFRATFDDERIAEAMGVNLRYIKLLAWTVGGGISGIGGALFAHNIGIIRPDNFQVQFSVLVLLAPIIGGYTRFYGVFIGAFVIIFGPHILNITEPETKTVLYGLLYIAFMLWRPDGVIDRAGFRLPKVFRLLLRTPSQGRP